MSKTKGYSDDFKNAVINVIKKSESRTQVAKDFGLLGQFANTWNKKFLSTGLPINKLWEKYSRLEAENAI